MIKSEYARILGMLDALKRTHVDGKLLDESAASYYKLLVMPIFKKGRHQSKPKLADLQDNQKYCPKII